MSGIKVNVMREHLEKDMSWLYGIIGILLIVMVLGLLVFLLFWAGHHEQEAMRICQDGGRSYEYCFKNLH